MIVAELFAKLGLRPDKKSFDVGEELLDGIKKQLAGIFALTQAVAGIKTSLAFAKALEDFDIASEGAAGSIDAVRKRILDMSDATGVAKEELLAGQSEFVALTGDAEASVAALEGFAKVKQATGAAMQDISASAAAMRQNLQIDPKDFEKGFSILIAGGKEGAIELKDTSKRLAELAPLAAQFAGGTGVRGLAKLGAAFQLTRQGFGSAAESATGLKSLMGSIVQNASKLEAGGVKVFNKDAKTGVKTLRSWDEIIDSLATSKLTKDPTLLVKALGSKEAYATYLQLTKVDGAWSDLTEKTLQANDVAVDYAKRQRMDTAKIQKAWNRVRNASERVFGVVVKALALLTDAFAWLGDNMALVVLAITSLTVAMGILHAATIKAAIASGILRAASIKAALASAAAWLASLAPFVLLAAAVAAVILVVEDLWAAFSGKESFFKDVYLAAKKWIDEKLTEVIESAKDKIADFLTFGLAKERRERIKAETEAINQEFDALGARIDETLAKSRQQAAEEQRRWDAMTPEEKEAFFAANRARGEARQFVESIAGPAMRPFRGSQSSAPNITMTINTQPGEDAHGIAVAVKRVWQDFWDAEMRSTAAATGQ